MSAAEAPKPLLLLVDDLPANLHLLAAALKADYRIKTATSGRAALELVALDDQPDLVLLDVMMPGMSGLEVLAALRAEPRTREVPVIIVTAADSEATESEGLDLGADDYLTKPVSPVVLLARVRNVLRRRAAELARERALGELRRALAEVRRLSGFIPICAYCKKVRDDAGFWSAVEAYISERSEAVFSHGVCPTCMTEQFAEELAEEAAAAR